MTEITSRRARAGLQDAEVAERAQPVHDPLAKRPIGSPALAAALRAVAAKPASGTGR